jgi:hypothetical protein
MKRSMIFVESSKSMIIKIMRISYDHKKTNYSRIKHSCLTNIQENENGGIVGQTSDNQAFLIFSF